MKKPIHHYQPVPPAAKFLARMELALRVFWWPAHLILRGFLKLTTSGAEDFPKEGPVLVLANHVSYFDPVLLILAAGRPIQFLATRALLRAGPMGLLLKLMGVIPKKKFTADPGAIKLMKRWRDLGGAVGLFPEGERTWDGRPLPLVPGIEKLVRLLDAPVVTARIVNADRQWPRWARRSRWGRVHVAFDPPRRFPKGTPMKEIRDYIEAQIRVEPSESERWPVRGRELAEGLTLVVFACPACGALDALQASGEHLHCDACSARWRVTSENVLTPDPAAPTTPTLTVVQAIDRARAHLAPDWLPDPERFAADGVVLESRPLEIHDISGQDSRSVGAGRLRLTATTLEIPDIWRLSLDALRVVDVNMQDQLHLRTRDRLFEIHFSDESPIKWKCFIERWRAQ